MHITGLGYVAEYFTLDDHDVVHAAVTYVDPLVRAGAPVWLPHIAPTPLCGLGRGACKRCVVTRSAGPPCRSCVEHLRDLDGWVRQAELRLTPADALSGAAPPAGNRLHEFPF